MFQFPGLAAMQLCIHCMLIQESRAHHLFVGSPKLFADFHAFHRLSIPRHPPCALSNLTIGISHSNPISWIPAFTRNHCIEILSDFRFKLPTSFFNLSVNQSQFSTCFTFAYILLRSFENSFDPLPIQSVLNSKEPRNNQTSG